MKIWDLNGTDWYMANNAKEAREDYIKFVGPHAEIYDEGPIECTDEELDGLLFIDEDYNQRSFREELAQRVKVGIKSQFFASTEF